jgi:rhodanese-related sulfurtransferase
MKKLLLILVLFVVVWDAGWAAVGVKPLFPWQLQAEYAEPKPGLVLLDVRTPTEYGWFHIPGAKNEPFQNLEAVRLKIPKDQTVVVICMTGHRSPLVAWHLQKNGYGNVYHLTWGMAGWEAYRFFSGLVSEPKPLKPEIKKISG